MKFDINGEWYSFYCPACARRHHINNTWNIYGVDKPTVHPSVLSLYRHPKGYTNDNPAPLGYTGEYVEDICHLFIREGRLEYLGDCTHSMANEIVDMVDIGT